MIKLLCILNIYCLYLSAIIVCYKYRHYVYVFLRKARSYNENNVPYSIHGCIYAKVIPVYRKEYFGYESFCLPELGNKPLIPDRKMRTYGIIRQYTECLLIVKDDYVKTIVALDDKRYGISLEEDIRKLYKIFTLISIGGILLWQICSQYMI